MENNFRNMDFNEKSKSIPKNVEHFEALQQDVDIQRKKYIKTRTKEIQEKYRILEEVIVPLLHENKIPYYLASWPEEDANVMSYQAFDYNEVYSEGYFKALTKRIPQLLSAALSILTLMCKWKIIVVDSRDLTNEKYQGYYHLGKYYPAPQEESKENGV